MKIWEKIMCSSSFSKGLQCGIEEINSSTAVLRIRETLEGSDHLEHLNKILSTVDHSRVILDLAEVREMKSIGFARLIATKRRLHRIGRQLLVRGLQQQPHALCNLLKLAPLLVDGSEYCSCQNGQHLAIGRKD